MKATEVKNRLKDRPLSMSSIKQFDKSPKHYVHYITTYILPTKAQILGQAVDCLIFSGEAMYKEKFKVLPSPEEAAALCGEEIKETFYRTNAGKLYKKTLEAEVKKNKGSLLDEDMAEKVKYMAESLYADPDARALLEYKGEVHKWIKWKHKQTKLPFIGQIDKLIPGEMILDLKISKDAGSVPFTRDVMNFKYYLQAGMYTQARGMLDKPFINIVVENVEPFGVAIREYTSDMIRYGFVEYNRLAGEFARAIEEDLFWQGYQFWELGSYALLDLPGWAKMKLDD